MGEKTRRDSGWLARRLICSAPGPICGPLGPLIFRFRLASCIDHTHTVVPCPTLSEKQVAARILWHAATMRLLRVNIGIAIIALWLGREKDETLDLLPRWPTPGKS